MLFWFFLFTIIFSCCVCNFSLYHHLLHEKKKCLIMTHFISLLSSGNLELGKFMEVLCLKEKLKIHRQQQYISSFLFFENYLVHRWHERWVRCVFCGWGGAHKMSFLDFLFKTVKFQKLSHFRGCKWDFFIITIFIYRERNEKLWWC